MIPLSDGVPARRFPFVNVALIAANFAVWLFWVAERRRGV
jgi:rhomboid family protein